MCFFTDITDTMEEMENYLHYLQMSLNKKAHTHTHIHARTVQHDS